MRKSRRLPRLTAWLLIAVALVAVTYCLEPTRLPSVVAKLANFTLAGVVAYWFDRGVFYYARPDRYLIDTAAPLLSFDNNNVIPGCEELFIAACRRRAIIIGAAMLAVALGV